MKGRFKKNWMRLFLPITLFAAVVLGSNETIGVAAAKEKDVFLKRSYIGYDTPALNWYRDTLNVSQQPMITVLTHGLGGSASHWSNNYETGNLFTFTYDQASLIEQLRNKVSGTQTYLVDMVAANDFHLEKLTKPSRSFLPYTSTRVRSIVESDLDQHMVLVFEATSVASNGSNAAVYQQFSYMLNKLANDVAYLTNGIYPKFNLIGHSRGGITNLMYAMDYPRLVDSIYSLGTPYTGSEFGKINAFAHATGSYNTVAFNDIQNWQPHLTRWNAGYDSGRYDHISVNTFSVNASLQFLEQLNSAGQFATYGTIMTDLIEGLSYHDNPLLWLSAYNQILNGIHAYEDSVSIPRTPNAVANHLFNDIITSKMWHGTDNIVLNDDLFVGVASQEGRDSSSSSSYHGFTRHFGNYYLGLSNVHLGRVSSPEPAIPHNLEARDAFVIGKIVNMITLGHRTPLYITRSISTSLVEIIGTNYYLKDHVDLPSMINGKVVIGIGIRALSAQFFVEEITIPNTVTYIGDSAFASCQGLREIIIANSVTTIDRWAFVGCWNLERLVLPSSVNFIGHQVFEECDGRQFIEWTYNPNLADTYTNDFGLSIKSIYVPNNTSVLNLPRGMTKLTQGMIINGTSLNTVTIPSTLTKLGTNAFANCPNLRNMVIPATVTSVEANAFPVASNLEMTWHYNYSLEGTAITFTSLVTKVIIPATANPRTDFFEYFPKLRWIEVDPSNPYVSSQDGVLYNKNKTEILFAPYGLTGHITIPSTITSFRGWIFNMCHSLQGVIIPAGVNYLENGSFAGCYGLECVEFLGNNVTVCGGSSVFPLNSPYLVILVPSQTYQNYYLHSSWQLFRHYLYPL